MGAKATNDEFKMDKRMKGILEKRGIMSDLDLCYLTPYKFYDFTKITYPGIEHDGKYVSVAGTLKEINKKSGSGRTIIVCKLYINEHMKLTITYLGQAYMYEILKLYKDKDVVVSGKLQYSCQWDSFSMLNPMQLRMADAPLRWVKIYPKYTGISAERLEDAIHSAMQKEQLPETFPSAVLQKTKLPSRKDSLYSLHHPQNMKVLRKAVQRQVFEDLLYFACVLEHGKKERSTTSKFVMKKSDAVKKAISTLPFKLTEDQAKVVNAVLESMVTGKRVNALIQGDVGCGKTIVAFLIMLAMADSGYQAALMAPTLVLAQQHYKELREMAEPLGFKVAFLGGKKTNSKDLEGIKNGSIKLVIGTHAVLGSRVVFKNLGAALIDEEHRFGVEQRTALAQKAKEGVHTISFSATPIPRTMAASIYGDTDIYEIKTVPSGRKPVKTCICKSENATMNFIKQRLIAGEQIYVVCPLIDGESEKKTVKEVATLYTEQLGINVGVVTGKEKDNQSTIAQFKEGKLQILAATTVIEVGVNVPNATVIVINDAWMFGLSQLHQLRGRVGRGNKQGYCILQTDEEADTSRLQILTETTDGFKVAEADLMQRGAGNLIGTEQSGTNRFMYEAMEYPGMFAKAKEFAEIMVRNGSDKVLIEEMEKRSEKIYVNTGKLKFF